MFNDGKPDLPLPMLAAFAADGFGIRGDMAKLGSERDQNVSIIDASGAYVLKVANLGDDVPLLELQNTIMQTAAQYQGLPPVPRIVPSRRNRLIETLDHHGQFYAVRILTLLPGVAAACVAGTAGLWNAIGQAAAHLARSLRAVDSELSRPLLWDITSAAQARPFVPYVTDRAERELLGAVLDDAESVTLPQLARLPRQWIHNDLNLNNLLVDAQNPAQVCGIIDFGDMVASPPIVELAIAAAHQCGREPDPFPAMQAVASAYHSVNPLGPVEIELLPRLISLRLTMAVLIRHARAVTTGSHFDPADYAQLIRALAALRQAGQERCVDDLCSALQKRPSQNSGNVAL